MGSLIRRARPAMVALVALMLTTGVVAAGPQGDEPVNFELTLSGDVDRDDTFGLFHQCETRNECVFIHDVDPVCSSNEELNAAYGWYPCAARTYRVTYERVAGDSIDYAIAFWDEEFHGPPEYLLRDSITVPEGGITLRLEYDYSRGLAPVTPTAAPALPDTAAPAPGDVVPVGFVLVAVSLLALRSPIGRSLGRT